VNRLTRISNLRETAFTETGFDGYVIFNSTNLLYFLGFPGPSALLVPADGECTVYVYGVNYEQAKAQGSGFTVELVRGDENLMAKIASEAQNRKIKKLAADALGVQSWRNLTSELSRGVTLEVNNSFIEPLRAVKDPHEIELMRKAGELTSEGMNAAYEAVKPGAKEYEVAAEIEYAMRKRGAGPTAFESIVASGACSAFPHGGCTGREIREGDLVVVDIGATYNYYCSDMTRTLVAGKPSAKQQKIYDTVKAAQQKAFEATKAGVVVADLDSVARRVITDAGYGAYFVHRLGHGVGLEVHEPPSMGPNGKDKLAAGFVVTDEPGIYIPDFGGVRVEDTVLVGLNKSERLTAGPYSFNIE
jgi:Xaa-Pro aminopeptidase